jgi:hypothetical protein
MNLKEEIMEDVLKKFDLYSKGVKLTLKTFNKNQDCEICSLCGINVEKLRENIKDMLSSSLTKD